MNLHFIRISCVLPAYITTVSVHDTSQPRTAGSGCQDIEMAKNKENEPPNEPRWAWFALLGCCYSLWFFGGVYRCMGIFYVAIMETFNATPFEASLFSVSSMVIGIAAAPLAGIAADRLSLQTVMAITSVTGAAGFVVAGFAPNLWSFILSYALLAGSSVSVISMAVTVSVTKMFHRNRTFANGCLYASSSLGGMVMPSLYAYLLDLYTIRGTFIVIGALWFQQMSVAVMLNPKRMAQVIKSVAEAGKVMRRVSSQPKFTMHSEFVTSNELCNSEQELAKPKQTDSSHLNGQAIKDGERSIVPRETKMKTGTDNPAIDIEEPPTTPVTNEVNSDKNDSNASRAVTKTGDARPKQDNADTSPNGTISVQFQEDPKEKKPKKKSVVQDIKELSKMGVFYGIFFSFMFLNIGMMNTSLFMPAFSGERGISLVEYGVLLSVGGAIELVLRVFYGYIGDLSCTNHYMLLGMITIACGVSNSFLSYLTSKFAVYGTLACVRVFGTVHLMYFGPVVMAAVGVKKTGTAMGMVRAPGRMGLAVAQLAFGSYREVTGSYSDVIRLASFFYIAGGIMLVLMSSTGLKGKIRKKFRSDIYIVNP